MNEPADADSARVSEPVVHALDSVILVTTISFALSVLAVLATVFMFDEPLHSLGHVALPAVMGVVILARLLHVLTRRRPPTDDAWVRAKAIASFDTRLAEVLSVATPAAWLVGSAAILVRHASDFQGLGVVIGFWLPLAAALWICATFAWTDGCRDRIGIALDESDRRYREYWQAIARRPGA